MKNGIGKMSIQTVVCLSAILIVLDQATKLIIHHYYMDDHFTLIPSLLEFKPTFNTQHSYVNVLLNQHFGINMGLLPHLVIFTVSELLIVTLYLFFRKGKQNTLLLDVAMSFQLASLVCALAGNLLWKGGTLDFLYLKPLFVFDLKDLYSNCFVVLFLLWINKHGKRDIQWKRDSQLHKKPDIK